MKKYIGVDISKNTFDVCIIGEIEKPIFKKYSYNKPHEQTIRQTNCLRD